MFTRHHRPWLGLEDFIQRIVVVHYRFDSAITPPTNPFPPHPGQTLYFYPYEKVTRVDLATGANNPLKSWMRAGIPVAVAPDGLINPFLGIRTMCTGQADPKENLTIEQAVIAYTRNAAYAEFAETRLGTLTPGKLADLAVLSRDIFTIPANELVETRSLLTIVDGKIVFDAGVFK